MQYMRHCTDRRKHNICGSGRGDWLAGCVYRHSLLAGYWGCCPELVWQLRLKKVLFFRKKSCRVGLLPLAGFWPGPPWCRRRGERPRVGVKLLLLHRKDERTLSSVIPDTGCCRGCAVGTAVCFNHSESSDPAALKGVIRLNVASDLFYRFPPSYRHFKCLSVNKLGTILA